jgi:hypothetical protein
MLDLVMKHLLKKRNKSDMGLGGHWCLFTLSAHYVWTYRGSSHLLKSYVTRCFFLQMLYASDASLPS